MCIRLIYFPVKYVPNWSIFTFNCLGIWRKQSYVFVQIILALPFEKFLSMHLTYKHRRLVAFIGAANWTEWPEIILETHPSIFYTRSLLQSGSQGFGVCPSCHRVTAGLHPRQVGSSSPGQRQNKDKEFPICLARLKLLPERKPRCRHHTQDLLAVRWQWVLWV